jgi:hypothetical protein
MSLTNGSNQSAGVWSAIKIDRERSMLVVDCIAAALAVSLPWSTSATGILAAVWIVAFIPTIEKENSRRVLCTAAAGLPVLLCLLGVAGMLWADVSLLERWKGLESFLKLLVIPMLMIHFLRSERGRWAMIGFLASCGVLLVYSWGTYFFPTLAWRNQKGVGIPVKDYISQSVMFIICAAALIDLAYRAWQEARHDMAMVIAVAAVAFVANILFIATSRTALVILPILLAIYGLKRFGWKGAAALTIALGLLAALSWSSASLLGPPVG